MSFFPGNSTSSVMWAPVVAFSCILVMMVILLSLPFLLTRARRVPAINRALDKLACLMGSPWPPVDEHPPEHVRKPLSRAALNSLAVSQYKIPSGSAAASTAATATVDCEAQSEDADACPICFCEYSEGQELITLPCKHFFHKECISRWLKRDATCPMCKLDLQEAAERQSSGSSAASTAASSSGGGGGSSNTSITGAGQQANDAAAAGAGVAGVPVATGSPAVTAAAAGAHVAASSALAGEQCLTVAAVQPTAPSAPQAVVVTVQ
jgi:hypothetical protein